MILAWLPVFVPWMGAALLAVLPWRPALLVPAVVAASFLAAAASVALGGEVEALRPNALGSALLLAGALAVLLAVVADAAARSGAAGGERRFVAVGLSLLQGAGALALLAADPLIAWLALAMGSGAGAALVALSGGRRAFAAGWRMLLLGGAGSAIALLGLVLLRISGAMPVSGLSGLGVALCLLGYGALAGLLPLGMWLPRAVAHAAPTAAVALAGLLLPAALHALFRIVAASARDADGDALMALLVAVGLATALLAAIAAWRQPVAAARRLPGHGAAMLTGFAAVGFGLGGAAGEQAGVLLLLGLPFSVGAAVLGAVAGGPVAALGRASLAGMPPFAPFVALALLFSAVAALPAAWALPIGAALLVAAAAQLGAAAAGPGADSAIGRPGLLVLGPPWLLLALTLALGAALPERAAAVLAEAARFAR